LPPTAQTFLAEVAATPLRKPSTANGMPGAEDPARAASAAPAPARPDAVSAMPAAAQNPRVTCLLMWGHPFAGLAHGM
jgi:hypothetical protein